MKTIQALLGIALLLSVPLFAQEAISKAPGETAMAGCPQHAHGAAAKAVPGNGMGHGRNAGEGKGAGRHGRGMGPSQDQPGHHDTIHELMADHKAIKRVIEDIPTGVRTTTTSSDPEVTAKIRLHVRQMYERLESGTPIRMMDPLFREVFAHADKIKMDFEDVEGGIRVTETSEDPQVQLLVREHARVVSQFVSEGMPRMPKPSALPEGYKPTQDAAAGGCGGACCRRGKQG